MMYGGVRAYDFDVLYSFVQDGGLLYCWHIRVWEPRIEIGNLWFRLGNLLKLFHLMWHHKCLRRKVVITWK